MLGSPESSGYPASPFVNSTRFLIKGTDASAASLMPFVEESVEPGSVVVTDNWSGYDPLKKQDYQRRIISINNRREQACFLGGSD